MSRHHVFPAGYRLHARWRRRKDGFHVDVTAGPDGRHYCTVPPQPGVVSPIIRQPMTETDAAQWARKTVQAGPEALRHLTMELRHAGKAGA